MKKYNSIILLVIGILIGLLFRCNNKIIKTNTVYSKDTIKVIETKIKINEKIRRVYVTKWHTLTDTINKLDTTFIANLVNTCDTIITTDSIQIQGLKSLVIIKDVEVQAINLKLTNQRKKTRKIGLLAILAVISTILILK